MSSSLNLIRLSSRSPKDAALATEQMQSLLDKEFNHVSSEEQNIDYPNKIVNQKLHALYRASTYSLRVENGAQAVMLLIQSKRIQGMRCNIIIYCKVISNSTSMVLSNKISTL